MPRLVSVATLPNPGLQEQQPRQPLYWGYDLGPNIGPNEIYANVGAIKTLARFAGLSSVVVRGGEADEPAPQEKPERIAVTGFSEGGVATGIGSLWQRPVPPARTSHSLYVAPEDRRPFACYEWPVLNLTIDRGDIAKSVAAREPEVTPAKALARALDGAMRTGILQAAHDNLMQEASYPKLQLAFSAATLGMLAYAFAELVLLPNTPEASLLGSVALANYVLMWGVMPAMYKASTGSFEFKRRRFSLSPFPIAPDRNLATKGVAFVLPSLITYKEQSR